MRQRTNMSEAAINFWAGGLGANTFWLCAFPCGKQAYLSLVHLKKMHHVYHKCHTNLFFSIARLCVLMISLPTLCVCFEIDVVKNKIMTQPDVKNPPFPTIASCFKHVYRTDGLKGFYRGKVPPHPSYLLPTTKKKTQQQHGN